MNHSAALTFALSIVAVVGISEVRADTPAKEDTTLRLVRVVPQSAWHGRPLQQNSRTDGEVFKIVRVNPPSAWVRSTPNLRYASGQVRLIRLVPERYRKQTSALHRQRVDARAADTPTPAS